MSQTQEEETIELRFYEVRGDSWDRNIAIYAKLNDPFDRAVAKAASELGIRSEDVAVVTPDGANVRVYQNNQSRTVKDIVESYGFTFGLTSKDLLG